MPATTSVTSFVSQGFILPFLLREPEIRPPQPSAIVLLHGVGSNENSLFGLERQVAAGISVIAPRGTYELGTDKYGWYEVDFSAGEPVINEMQEEHSRKILIEFIEQLKQVYRFHEVYLGGFSQGAVMSYSTALTHAGLVNGIMILSGRILPVTESLMQVAALAPLKVFIAHGIQDAVVRIVWARAARKQLEAAGLKPQYHEYSAGHQVTDDMVRDLAAWITLHIAAG